MEQENHLKVTDVTEYLYQNRYKYFPDFPWQLYVSNLDKVQRLSLGEKKHKEHGLKTFGKDGLLSKLLRVLKREKLSIDKRKIFSSDVSIYRGPIIQSNRFLIKGKPDYIVAEENYQVPIEIKPTAKTVFPHHEWQVKLYCLLLDPHSKFVSYGYLEIADGTRIKVEITQEDKIWLVKLIQAMGHPIRM